MKKANRKIFFIIFFLIFVCLLGFFVYWREILSKKDAPEELIVKFSTSKNVLLNNKLPISDALGKTLEGKGMEEGIQGYVEFSIENLFDEKKDYTILITKQDIEKNEINGNFIKFYLTNDEDKPYDDFSKNVIPSYTNLFSSSNKPASRILYQGTIEKKSKETFRLRVWLADNYAFTSQEEEFSMNIDVQR